MSDTKRRIKGIEQRLNVNDQVKITCINSFEDEAGTHTATADLDGERWTVTRNTKEELDAAIKERFPNVIKIKWP